MKITYCSTLKLSTFQSWFPIRKTKYFFSKQKGPSFASKFQLPNSVKSHVTRAPQQCEGCSTSSCAFTSWFCIQWLLSWWPWKKLPPKRSATIFCLLFCLLLLLLLLLPLLLCVLCCCKSGWCACFLAHTVWVFFIIKIKHTASPFVSWQWTLNTWNPREVQHRNSLLQKVTKCLFCARPRRVGKQTTKHSRVSIMVMQKMVMYPMVYPLKSSNHKKTSK